MPGQEPADQLANNIQQLNSKVNELHSKVRLANLRDEVEDLTTSVNNLAQRIKDMRSRGYVFGKEMEAKAVSLAQQWTNLRAEITGRVEQESRELQAALRPIEEQLTELNTSKSIPFRSKYLYEQLAPAVENLSGKVDAAANSIHGMYDSFQGEVNAITAHLSRVEWMLNQLAEASFQLLANEGAVMAVKAVWAKEGKEDRGDPRGVLYLTDQRLIFEQKQEIATRKVLFVTMAKEKVQKMLLALPVALVQNAKAQKQGFLGHEDHIYLTYASGAPTEEGHFHLDGQDCNEWQRLIGRARSGDFDQDRAIAVDQSVVEKVKAAPTKCPSCGAAIDKPILRGMDSIKCDYCGHVIRL